MTPEEQLLHDILNSSINQELLLYDILFAIQENTSVITTQTTLLLETQSQWQETEDPEKPLILNTSFNVLTDNSQKLDSIYQQLLHQTTVTESIYSQETVTTSVYSEDILTNQLSQLNQMQHSLNGIYLVLLLTLGLTFVWHIKKWRNR